MPDGLFRQGAEAPGIQTPQVRAPERVQSILAEGQAAAQIGQTIGQVAGIGIQVAKKQEQRDDNLDRINTTTELDTAFKKYKAQMAMTKNKNKAKKLRDDFLKQVTTYGTAENGSGSRNLRSNTSREWYTNEYAPKVKAATGLAFDLQLEAINETDSAVKFNTSRNTLTTTAANPSEAMANSATIQTLYDAQVEAGRISRVQANEAIKQDIEITQMSSIRNQADRYLDAEDISAEDAKQWGEVLKEQIGVYGLEQKQETELNDYINQKVGMATRREKIRVNAAKAEKAARDEATDEQIFGLMREAHANPERATEILQKAQQVADDSGLSEKQKYQWTGTLEKMSNPKSANIATNPEFERKFRISMANLRTPGATNADRQKALDTLRGAFDRGMVSPEHFTSWWDKVSAKLEEHQNTELRNVMAELQNLKAQSLLHTRTYTPYGRKGPLEPVQLAQVKRKAEWTPRYGAEPVTSDELEMAENSIWNYIRNNPDKTPGEYRAYAQNIFAPINSKLARMNLVDRITYMSQLTREGVEQRRLKTTQANVTQLSSILRNYAEAVRTGAVQRGMSKDSAFKREPVSPTKEVDIQVEPPEPGIFSSQFRAELVAPENPLGM